MEGRAERGEPIRVPHGKVAGISKLEGGCLTQANILPSHTLSVQPERMEGVLRAIDTREDPKQ